ncbi:sucrose transport protein SUT4-like isoform X2 [Phoenix dactylifera]|uniref:Sucrose transport protein SUT4-like isoform X2 n=1 Tax=Phoenix dactylifera TaxID=42345 RepID=A0A8B7BJP0_PHODC|nr:sucrose transport protein SUT4-like isoform X2 [Phoenix dactylifera]
MDAVSIRVPYRHLNDAELELVALGDPNGEIDESRGGGRSRPVSSSSPPPSSSVHSDSSPRSIQRSSLKTLILSCMVGAGVQFGWALQLSLLTPYIQTLGIKHAFSSFIWLCGPITGFVVQPCVGIWSDKCHSKYGRRRPFILAGCLMISLAVTLIGFSADVGYLLGDTKEHCSTYNGPRYRAAAVFVIGFWMLDLANNTVQGPARALLADLAGPDQRNSANAIFCSWMALGNILGFSSGASGNWHRWFPFLTTKACCEVCGNLKAAFLVAVAFLMFCMLVTLYFAKEVPLEARPAQHLSDSSPLLNNSLQRDHESSQANLGKQDSGRGSEILGKANSDGHLDFSSDVDQDHIEAFRDGPGSVLINILTSLRHLPSGMHSVLLVMALTWASWFPFFLFDTDWMGREVYHGNPNGDPSESLAYHKGVREGAFGLLLNSVVLGVSSLLIDPMCRRMGARFVWAMSNFIVFICMAATTITSLLSISQHSNGIQHVIGENTAIKIAALVIFSILGFPLAITYSVPFSVTADLTADTGGGQDQVKAF